IAARRNAAAFAPKHALAFDPDQRFGIRKGRFEGKLRGFAHVEALLGRRQRNSRARRIAIGMLTRTGDVDAHRRSAHSPARIACRCVEQVGARSRRLEPTMHGIVLRDELATMELFAAFVFARSENAAVALFFFGDWTVRMLRPLPPAVPT